MTTRDRLGLTLLLVLLTLSSAGSDIRGTLTNMPLMVGISAVLAATIPRLLNGKGKRTWGAVLTHAVLGSFGGALLAALCHLALDPINGVRS